MTPLAFILNAVPLSWLLLLGILRTLAPLVACCGVRDSGCCGVDSGV